MAGLGLLGTEGPDKATPSPGDQSLLATVVNAVPGALTGAMPGVLVVAMLSGACQQLVTRYIDQRAEAILKAVVPQNRTSAAA